MLGPDNAIWDDGEWVGWGEIDRQIHYKEWVQNIPMPNVGRANTRSFNLLKKTFITLRNPSHAPDVITCSFIIAKYRFWSM
ncbi:MAG: hypothetical protein QUV08_01120 [Parasphingorhabdus sp.]|nr:hypothetical protein [Parasphingorhabdus sp.]